MHNKTTFSRPGWDKYFMDIALVAATRSNCCRRQVAAIIVKDNRIISTGYNGTPRGLPNCFEGGCNRCASNVASGSHLTECICCHAEENAIVSAAYHGISTKNSKLYTTYSPCLLCTKMIINAGITEVIYFDQYSIDDLPQQLLKTAGININKLSEK